MQDKFVGDVGDFGKYGLLNYVYTQSQENICKEKICIGINWYKNTKEKENNDGKFTNYLKDDFNDREKYL